MAESRFKVTVHGQAEISRMLTRVQQLYPLKTGDLNHIGRLWVQRIKKRTAEGKDAGLQTFVPYSAFWKRKRRQKGLRTDVVNLSYSGQMLSSLGFKVTKDSIKLSFNDPKQAQKAFGLHYGDTKRNLPPRPFFTLNETDLDAALAYLDKTYGRKL